MKFFKKKLLLKISISLVTTLVCLLTVEIIIRNHSVSDIISWNRIMPLGERIQNFNFQALTKAVVLGDSFVEWRAGQHNNMISILEKNMLPQQWSFLNIGKTGTGIVQYIHTYKELITFKPDKVLMFIYLGNDIFDFYPRKYLSQKQQFSYQKNQEIKFFLKQSATIHLLYRICRKNFTIFQTKDFEKNIEVLQKQFEIDENIIQKNFSLVDPEFIKLAQSDTINHGVVATAIARPHHFKEILAVASDETKIAIDKAVKKITAFKEEENIDLLVVIIPHGLQVSTELDEYERKCGFDLEDFSLLERRKLTTHISQLLELHNIAYLDTTLDLAKEKNIYIHNDEHLNSNGHKIIAEAVGRYLRNNKK